ncbi:hypothetical protein STEG23_033613, partial [Scotinomys teguina]
MCALGSWILQVGARLLPLDCTSSPLDSVPYPFLLKLGPYSCLSIEITLVETNENMHSNNCI